MQVTVLSTETTGLATKTYQTPAATKGHTVQWWYDRRSRNWIVQYKDGDDNQIGAADYVATRASAVRAAERMAKETRQSL